MDGIIGIGPCIVACGLQLLFYFGFMNLFLGVCFFFLINV